MVVTAELKGEHATRWSLPLRAAECSATKPPLTEIAVRLFSGQGSASGKLGARARSKWR